MNVPRGDHASKPLRKNYPYSELLSSLFSRIRAEYGEIRSIFQTKKKFLSYIFMHFLMCSLAILSDYYFVTHMIFYQLCLKITNKIKDPKFKFIFTHYQICRKMVITDIAMDSVADKLLFFPSLSRYQL